MQPFLAMIMPLASGTTPPDGGTPPSNGGPVDPGYSPPWAQIPPGGGTRPPRPSSPRGTNAVVMPMPATDPPTAPPAGLSPDSKQVLIWFGPGTQPAVAWVAPYASTGPITPPAEGTPPA
jgi:hypothetical protein